MKRVYLAAALATAVAAPAHADLPSGLAAFEAAQYDKAYAELKPLADGGDGEAQFRVGQMTENGWGVRGSYQQALAWYRRAADRGHVDATVRVAEFYKDGLGTPRSRREAYDWYLKAAERGHAKSMTLVARWNLEGTAKRPNFLVGKKWLNQAAATGDAEAQELLDTLASKNFPVLDIPGSPDPTDEAARRVMTEVKDLLEPMLQAQAGSTRLKLGQPAAVVKTAEGGQLVTLPMAELTGDQGTWRLGTVQVVFVPDGDDYAVEVKLPSQSRLVAADGHERGRLRIATRKVTGKWSTGLHTLTDYKAELGGLTYDSTEGVPWSMTVEQISAQRSYTALGNGRYDVAETGDARGIRTEGGIGAAKRVGKMAGAAYGISYKNLDVPALSRVAEQFGVDWRSYARLAGAGSELPEGVPQLLGGLEATVKLGEMVTEDGAGQRVSALASSELVLAGKNLDQALSTLSLRYSHDGLSGGEGGETLPARAEIALTADKVPAGDIIAAGMTWLRGSALPAGRKAPRGQVMVSAALPVPMPTAGIMPDLSKLTDALRGAKSELRIEKVALTGEGYTVALSGSLAPAGDGVATKLDIAVGGLDKLIGEATVTEDEPAPTINPVELLRRVKGMAVTEKDGAGAEVKVFRVSMQPDGKVTVNGKDAAQAMGR